MGAIGGEDHVSWWIQREIDHTRSIKKDSRGRAAKRVQEWLQFHGFGLVIDGDFGSVTKRKVQEFQDSHGLTATGIVNSGTYQALIAPFLHVLEPIPVEQHTFSSLVASYAKVHLSQNPHEIGGQNRGPWVRLYMKGHEGHAYPWCAGFVTFILKQAAETLGMSPPIKGSMSCDSLAAQGKEAGLFVQESELSRRTIALDTMSRASIFLVRRSSTDWTHTGLATEFYHESFDTIEGNTNDEGSREGYEVCTRARGYKKKDFILL